MNATLNAVNVQLYRHNLANNTETETDTHIIKMKRTEKEILPKEGKFLFITTVVS